MACYAKRHTQLLIYGIHVLRALLLNRTRTASNGVYLRHYLSLFQAVMNDSCAGLPPATRSAVQCNVAPSAQMQ